jgi:hypothetical protein
MQHRGNIVEKRIRESGYSIKHVAAQLNVIRQTLYNWFEIHDLDPHKILRVGKAIGHDFTKDFPALYDPQLLLSEPQAHYDKNDSQCRDELQALWKRYGTMMEKYINVQAAMNNIESKYNKLIKDYQVLKESK